MARVKRQAYLGGQNLPDNKIAAEVERVAREIPLPIGRHGALWLARF